MTITNFGTDVLASLPDLPRWVEARGMLQARRAFVVDTADGCRLICGRKDRLVVPTTRRVVAPGRDHRHARGARHARSCSRT